MPEWRVTKRVHRTYECFVIADLEKDALVKSTDLDEWVDITDDMKCEDCTIDAELNSLT